MINIKIYVLHILHYLKFIFANNKKNIYRFLVNILISSAFYYYINVDI